ncbi:MAG: polyprenyl synthetase family protein [Clostridia bacterium]|nr:polyprenyl synthetase family protein [Clostridia bacterium]
MGTKEKLKEYAELIDREIDKLLVREDEDIKPLLDSMRYSASAGGKRIRPYLTLVFCELLGGDIQKAIPYACAVELVHTYSLIHDDLPAMDNDDFRRGKPTNHKAFGEARAILAGDALLTYAFEVIADNKEMSAEDNLTAIRILAKASGAFGMVGGQEIDLDESAPKDYDKLVKMHRLKTGALIEGAALLGVLAAGKGKDEKILAATSAYADAIGLTFQIVDDILDYTASYMQTGKTTSDLRNGKTTFLTFMTAEEAFDKAVGVTAEGVRAISFFEGKKELTELARFLLFRTR